MHAAWFRSEMLGMYTMVGGIAATRQYRATAQFTGRQTTGSRGCSHDQSKQSNHHLMSGTIPGAGQQTIGSRGFKQSSHSNIITTYRVVPFTGADQGHDRRCVSNQRLQHVVSLPGAFRVWQL